MSLIKRIYEAAAKIRQDLPPGVSEQLAKFAIEYFLNYGHVSEHLVAGKDWKSVYLQVLSGVHWVANCFDDSPNVLELLKRLPEVQRCGCPDFPDVPFSIDSSFRVELLQAKWNKRLLKVWIASYCPNVSQEDQTENMRKNLHNTAAVCGLEFELIQGADGKQQKPDLTLYAKKIDGVGRVLGQQYLPDGRDNPQYGELDIADMNSVSIHRRTSLHETCGHGVGCVHINSPGSVMNPYLTKHEIWQDADIEQLQRLYGPPTKPVVPTPAPVPPQPIPPTGGDTIDLRDMPNVKRIVGLDGWGLVKGEAELRQMEAKLPEVIQHPTSNLIR